MTKYSAVGVIQRLVMVMFLKDYDRSNLIATFPIPVPRMPKSRRFIPSIRPFTKKWDRVTDLNWFAAKTVTEQLPVDSLIGTQGWVRTQGVKDARVNVPIYVVRIGGKDYIRDGHHRVMRARYSGRQTIVAQVLDLGD